MTRVLSIAWEDVHGPNGLYTDFSDLWALDAIKSKVYDIPDGLSLEDETKKKICNDYPTHYFEHFDYLVV